MSRRHGFDVSGPRRFSGCRVLAGTVCALLAVACAHATSSFPSDADARPAAGAPPRFVTENVAVRPESGTPPVCRTPLFDPGDGTRITLVRSLHGTRGDYEVPAEHYGVRQGELLRVDCATGAVIGVVPR